MSAKRKKSKKTEKKSAELQPHEQLGRVLKKIDALHIPILRRDPDAFACAALFRELLAQRDIPCHIYAGKQQADNPQNNVIWTLAGFESIARPLSEYSGGPIALLDSSRFDDPDFGDFKYDDDKKEKFTDDDIVIVIDHHPSDTIEERDGRFVCIDAASGSATMLVAELCFALGIEFDEKDPVATVAAFGIMNDADTFTVGKDGDTRDVVLFNRLLAHGSRKDFASIERCKYPGEFEEAFARAIRKGKIIETRRVAGFDLMKGRYAESILVYVADRLIDREGITLAATWGIVKQDDDAYVVIVKLRSDSPNVNLMEVVNRFGDQFGGAKVSGSKGKGSVKFPATPPQNSNDQKMREIGLIGEIKAYIGEIVFHEKALAKKEDNDAN